MDRSSPIRACRAALALLAGLVPAAGACADSPPEGGTVQVAVAANLAPAHEELARLFTESAGIPVRTSLGATGQLYAQIRNGAPFHLFLAADTLRPALLEEEGWAVAGSRRPYAVGRLALFSSGAPLPDRPWDALGRPDVRVAVANPRTAPYGAAAVSVLEDLGLVETLRGRLVMGENVGQVFQFVGSGAAELGFVALASVVAEPPERWAVVPETLHGSLRQDLVLLEAGATHEGARAYAEFLAGDEAARVWRRFGYGLPDATPDGGSP